MKRNNFVTELINVNNSNGLINNEFTFITTKNHWLFIKTIPIEGHIDECSILLDGCVLYVHNTNMKGEHCHLPGVNKTLESMKWIKSGEHKITLQGGQIYKLEVLTVPEIQYGRFPCDGTDLYDWKFLQENILPHVNVIISKGYDKAISAYLNYWKSIGGKWLSYIGKPSTTSYVELWNYFSTQPGYINPLIDGVLVDEFGSLDIPYSYYSAVTIRLNSKIPEHSMNPYTYGPFKDKANSLDFANKCIDGGGKICWEGYIATYPTEQESDAAMNNWPGVVNAFKVKVPNILENMVWVLGASNHPLCWFDIHAQTNHLVSLDKQFHFLANNESFNGLGGISFWRAGYCTAETLKFLGKAFRHYCIEGNKERLLSDSYISNYINNPDFLNGFEGWTITNGDNNALASIIVNGLNTLLQKLYRGYSTCALMTKKKNTSTICQAINNLIPGKVYQITMISGNYNDMIRSVSREKINNVAIGIKNGILNKSTKYAFKSKSFGDFTSNNPFWFTQHTYRFTAIDKYAELIISNELCPVENAEFITNIKIDKVSV